MRTARICATVTASVLLASLTACGGGAEESADNDNGSGSGSGDSSALSGSASCEDKRGDGKGGDLTSVSLQSDGENLTATFETTKPIPSNGTALFAIDAWNEAGDTGYQLGLKYDGGQQIAHFVFDHVEANQTNLDGEASTDGTTTTATFPVSEVDSLGESFQWTAVYNLAGDDVDECPKPSGDIMEPNKETFPSE